MQISRTAVAAALLTAPVLLVGCSSSSSKGSPPSVTPAPEQRTTSPQAVTAGLRQIDTIARQVLARIADKSAATRLDGGIEPVWSTIEGTVKGNSADTYLAFEDAFALLEDAAKAGDATKAKTAADAIATSVKAYTAKYPA